MQCTGRSLFSYRWPRTPRTDLQFLLIGLERPREELYRRIEARVDAMFAGRARVRGHGPACQGLRAEGPRA